MQSFRKNGVFNMGFWIAAGVFAALAGFDFYHNPGGRPQIFLGVAALACAVAAFWGRGDLVAVDEQGVQLNLGLFNRKKVRFADIKKVKIEGERYVRLHLRGAAVNSVKISLALLHPEDRVAFVEFAERLAARIGEPFGE